MGLLFLYLFVAIFFSFLCSILEAVVLSITPTYISIKIEENSPLKKNLEVLKNDIDKPISAILTLNTFAHTLGAAGVGAQAQDIWGNEYLSLVSAVLTVLILIFSEIIPKTLGATYWRELAPAALRLMRALIIVLYPFVKVSQLLTRILKKRKSDSIFTRYDLQKMAEVVKKEGNIKDDESLIIQNLMKFNKIQVKDIMTPRTVLTARKANYKISEIRKEIDTITFSRIPIYNKSIDDITGFVLRDDILREMSKNNDKKELSEIARDIKVIPSNTKLVNLMDFFIKNKAHLALVVDEYGGTEGVVTIEDLMETLLGIEIVDEMDNVEDLRKIARQKWLNRAKKSGYIQDDK